MKPFDLNLARQNNLITQNGYRLHKFVYIQAGGYWEGTFHVPDYVTKGLPHPVCRACYDANGNILHSEKQEYNLRLVE